MAPTTCRSPGVYRFICSDGRSYVGSTYDLTARPKKGLARNNTHIKAAIEKYPPETWQFEVLEQFPAGCSERELRAAEQRHIKRLGTLDPECGFNIDPARPRVAARLPIPIGPHRMQVSIKDVCTHYGCSVAHVYRLLVDGHIIARRNGRRILVDVASVNAYFAKLALRNFKAEAA
jgi:hypothetical protein